MEKITIACACDNNFLPFTAAMLYSVFKNNSQDKIDVYLLHNGLKKKDLSRISHFVEKYNQKIFPIKIENNAIKNLRIPIQWSIANYYRLILPSVLPVNIEKVMYLDSDIIVRGSLLPIWHTKIDAYPLAAVEEVITTQFRNLYFQKSGKYLNSGVLLINLKMWREKNLQQEVFDYIIKYSEKLYFVDQDALNHVLYESWLPLDHTWNVIHSEFEKNYTNETIPEHVKNPIIVHFTGTGDRKPWFPKSSHPFKSEYIYYQRMTPWKYVRLLPYRGMTFNRFLLLIWLFLARKTKYQSINYLKKGMLGIGKKY